MQAARSPTFEEWLEASSLKDKVVSGSKIISTGRTNLEYTLGTQAFKEGISIASYSSKVERAIISELMNAKKVSYEGLVILPTDMYLPEVNLVYSSGRNSIWFSG